MSTTEQDLTIGPAAAALGVSVRTLRHWDDLGILRPAGRAASGYRLYSADDVVRGRRILAYRELGFSLDEVTALLHESAQQTVRRLRERRSAAEAEARRLQAAQDDLDRLADALEQGILLSEADQAEAFGPDWDPQWTREARDRWGGTDAWTEQAERGARRGPEQWARLAQGLAAVEEDLASAFAAGVAPGSSEADELADRHREALSALLQRLAAAPCPAGPDVSAGSVVPGPLRPPGRRSSRLARAGDRCPSPITGHRPGGRGLGVTVTGPNVVGRRC